MGFNKFKHLPKNECCQCIKDHLLPQRTSEDIKKQLSNISNSEQRQLKLKELLKSQKLNSNKNGISSKNFEFIKEVDYKSPLEQSDFIQLPSMYTLMIERLKMANILRDTKNHLKEKKEKANNNNNSNNNNSTNINDESCSFNSSTNSVVQYKNKTPLAASSASKPVKNKDCDSNHKATNKKRLRKSSSSSSTTSTSETSDVSSSNLSFLNRSTSRSPTKQISSTINATPKHSSINHQIDLELSTCSSSTTIERTHDEIEHIKTLRRTLITANNEKNTNENNENQNSLNKSNNNNNNNVASNTTPSTTTTTGVTTNSFGLPLSTNSSNNIFHLTANLNDRSILFPSLQPITLLKSLQQQQPQQQQQNSQTSPFLLPPNFSGTILYQPTIHIHTNRLPIKPSNNATTKKYRQIVPKK